jgi:hypothetical protein
VSEHLPALLQAAAAGLSFARHAFPLWTEHGLRDYQLTLHSVGVSYWVALGHHLGYCGVGELPAPPEGRYGRVGDDVRCDATWFDRASGRPVLLAEFERYDGSEDEPKLLGKVENLLLAHHRWGQSADTLVLAYWTRGLADLPSHDGLQERFRSGFRTPAMERVPGSACGTLLFYQFILGPRPRGRWRLRQIQARGAA